MNTAKNKPILNSIYEFADDIELYCEECGREVKREYFGIEIIAVPVFICNQCAKEIAERLLEIVKKNS